jgi:DNA-binding response OmpR family regulator
MGGQDERAGMTLSPTANGRRVLVAEDEALISVILSGDLRDEGYLIAGPFSRGQDALAWLADHTPDLAIVDYMLRDGPCTTLTRALRERGVPFVIFSGYPRDLDSDDEFADAPWFDKPASLDALLDALAALSPPLAAHTQK